VNALYNRSHRRSLSQFCLTLFQNSRRNDWELPARRHRSEYWSTRNGPQARNPAAIFANRAK
jgi:hypothetical protein